VNWPQPIGFSSLATVLAAVGLAFGAGALLALALTPALRDSALRWGWLDRPDGRRKLHAAAVPPVGGVAVLLALAGGFGLALLLPGVDWSAADRGNSALHLLAATAAVAAVGLLDDIRSLRPVAKLLVQTAAGLYLYAHGYDVSVISNPLGQPFVLGALSLPLTVLWVVGLSNAFNLIDGLDGLAAGVGFFANSVVFIFAVLNERWEIALFSAALAGALLGFLRYNFSPASVFLGDSGSLSVGFVLAALSLRGSSKSSTAVAVVAPLLALGFPILDTALAMLRRLMAGRSILEADADHIHHRMLRLGLQPRQAVMMLYAVTALFGAIALLAMTGHADAVAFAVLSFAVVTWTGIRRLAKGRARPVPGPEAAPEPQVSGR
jgi:UDP-GlcNAc:undecaprenyl-phosphate/decaprenyl-phosphate GlcNAc-1-phosphate transferase